MAFRYINPGYGALTGNSSVETFENTTYSPATGVSFFISASTLLIPTSGVFTTDIYGKVDLYFSNTVPAIYIGADSLSTDYSFARREIGILTNSDNGKLFFRCNNSQYGNGISLKPFAFNSIWFHIHRDEENSILSGEMIVNGKEDTFSYSGATSDNCKFSTEKYFGIYTARNTYISNLIISDDYISPKERIISLPTSQTFTDMTASASGIYIADAADQSLLQSVDVAQLIQDYGADSAITGIALVGNPAYKTAEGLAKLTALSKSGASIAEHDTIALSGDSSAAIMDGWGLSGVTIADLQNMQFGWKVGA